MAASKVEDLFDLTTAEAADLFDEHLKHCGPPGTWCPRARALLDLMCRQCHQTPVDCQCKGLAP